MTWKRTNVLAAGMAAGLLGAFIPAAHATVAAVQLNVRHVAHIPGSTGGHVVAEGDRLYVGAYGLGMTIFDIKNPAAPVKIGEYKPVGTSDTNVRADAVPDATVINGREIAALNGTNRAPGSQQTEFLDVTDPAAPVLLHRFTGATDGEAHNGDIVDGRNLWLPSGGSGSGALRIYDLAPLVQSPPAAPKRLFGGNPHTMWSTSPYRSGKPLGPAFDHTHDIEVYKDYNLRLRQAEWVDQDGDGIPDPTYGKRDLAFIAGAQGYGVGAPTNNTAVYIVDITKPSTPVVINKIQSVAGAGHHTVRYLHEVQLLEGDPHIMFTADEDLHSGCDAGGVYSWRLSDDLTTATKLDEWFIGTGTPAGVCSAHVFSSKGSYVFMGSYQAGFQVIDFTNPADLKRAGQYIAEGANSWGALYYRGYVYVGDFGGRGLDVFQFAANPAASGLVKTGNPLTRTIDGATETLAACESGSPGDAIDAVVVPIPADKRDGTHTIRASVSEGPGTEVDVWFFDTNCDPVDTGLFTDKGGLEQGLIPEGAASATAVLYTSVGPQYVYAQLDPPF